MESELSGIFRVKLVTKNIVRGSPGTQVMHMRVNNILSHIEVSKFEILFKPEIISKHHHTCFCIFLLIFVTLNSVILCFPK